MTTLSTVWLRALLIAIGTIGISTSAAGSLLFEDDFEDGTLDKWTIGGRQDARTTSIADTVVRRGSTAGHLFKFSFTEITLENTFDYDPLLRFEFDLEVTASSTPPPAPNFYGSATSDFYFLDDSGASLGSVWYGTATTAYLTDRFSTDPTRHFSALAAATPLTLDLSVGSILDSISIDAGAIDTVLWRLRTYSSTFPAPSVSAELWIDNVCVDLGDACDPTLGVPAPTSLALVGLALVALARRKRTAMHG